MRQYKLGDGSAKPLAEQFRIEDADGKGGAPVDPVDIVEPDFANWPVAIDDPGSWMLDEVLHPRFCIRLSESAGEGGAATEHAVDLGIPPERQSRLDVAPLRPPQMETLSFQFGRGRR
ncbi:hypothetical protein D3C71_1684440 [compost metagenome]